MRSIGSLRSSTMPGPKARPSCSRGRHAGEVGLGAYAFDRESANYSRDALEQLIEALELNPNVKEINLVAHSMGNWVTLEALRGRSIRAGRLGKKIRNVFLVAPDVDVDVFRTQIGQTWFSQATRRLVRIPGRQRTERVKGDLGRGAASRQYRSGSRALSQHACARADRRFRSDQAQGNAHSRAFDDITEVMLMIRERLDQLGRAELMSHALAGRLVDCADQ